jgi:hypothetical protein
MKCASIHMVSVGMNHITFSCVIWFHKILELWAQGELAPTPVVPSSFEWCFLVAMLSLKNVRFVLRDTPDLVREWDICNV